MRGHRRQCRKRFGRADVSDAGQCAISSTIVSPTASTLSLRELVVGVLQRVLVAVGPVDEVDGRDARAQERRVVVEDRDLGRVREDRATPTRSAGAADLLPQRGGRACPRAGSRTPLLPDVVQQDHRPDLLGVELHVGLRAAQRVAVEVVGRRAAPPRRRRGRSGCRARPRCAGAALQRAGQLDHRADRGGRVVGADEALGVVLGVVVGADDDHRPGAGQVADDVAQPGHARHGSRSARRAASARSLLGHAPQRPRARGALPGVDLHAWRSPAPRGRRSG